MAKAFRRKASRILGSMNADELGVVLDLLRLTRTFVAPEQPQTGDPLLDLIAGLEGSEMVGADGERPNEPEDPAMRRLLPPAHHTDTDQATEFRRLTEHTVRSRKAATLTSAIAALEDVEAPGVDLSIEQAQSVVVALTDVRLILGERLGMRTDEDSERLHEELLAALDGDAEAGSADAARVQQMAYYDFLTWLQDSITSALLKSR